MPLNLQTLYIPHLILTIALGGMKYYSCFIDKENKYRDNADESGSLLPASGPVL